MKFLKTLALAAASILLIPLALVGVYLVTCAPTPVPEAPAPQTNAWCVLIPSLGLVELHHEGHVYLSRGSSVIHAAHCPCSKPQ